MQNYKHSIIFVLLVLPEVASLSKQKYNFLSKFGDKYTKMLNSGEAVSSLSNFCMFCEFSVINNYYLYNEKEHHNYLKRRNHPGSWV